MNDSHVWGTWENVKVCMVWMRCEYTPLNFVYNLIARLYAFSYTNRSVSGLYFIWRNISFMTWEKIKWGLWTTGFLVSAVLSVSLNNSPIVKCVIPHFQALLVREGDKVPVAELRGLARSRRRGIHLQIRA